MDADTIPAGLEVEELWAIEAEYVADGRRRREPYRRAHLENFERLVREGVIVFGGALGDVESAFIVVRVPGQAEARVLAERDVYWTSGTWTGYRVRPYALVKLRESAAGVGGGSVLTAGDVTGRQGR